MTSSYSFKLMRIALLAFVVALFSVGMHAHAQTFFTVNGTSYTIPAGYQQYGSTNFFFDPNSNRYFDPVTNSYSMTAPMSSSVTVNNASTIPAGYSWYGNGIYYSPNAGMYYNPATGTYSTSFPSSSVTSVPSSTVSSNMALAPTGNTYNSSIPSSALAYTYTPTSATYSTPGIPNTGVGGYATRNIILGVLGLVLIGSGVYMSTRKTALR